MVLKSAGGVFISSKDSHLLDGCTLNEKVGFKRPTKCYRKNSFSCGALLSGTAQWTSGVGWTFDLYGS